MTENFMTRPIHEEPIIYGKCNCGCGIVISSEYEYIRWDNMFFVDRTCLFQYLKREHDIEEVG